ncbi:MAG: type II toxin-antitoxin system RelE/ParE family toxin [Opitutales bacterium]
MVITFYETTAFTEGVSKLKAEDQCLELKEELARNPAKGDLLRGTGGFRKVRMRLPGRGKSSGARVIYYYISADGVVYLVSLYAKNVQEDLTAKQTKQLKELSTFIEAKIKEAKDHE